MPRLYTDGKAENECRVESFTLPDGSYYVGCPLAILPDEPEEVLDEFIEYDSGAYKRDGHKFVVIPTGGDGFYDLYDMNEDGAGEDPDTGEPVDGPIHVDSLATDVGMMSIMPLELLKALGCDIDEVADSGAIFEVSMALTAEENGTDPTFEVEFKYKMYGVKDREVLSHVDFLWFKLNVTCQYMEDDK